MKHFVIIMIFFLFVSCSSRTALNNNPEKYDLAKKISYLQRTDNEKNSKKLIEQITKKLVHNQPTLWPFKKTINDFFSDLFQSNAFVILKTQVYMDNFSYEELNQMIELFQNPIYQNYINKVPQINVELKEMTRYYIRSKMPELRRRLAINAERLEEMEESNNKQL